MAKAKAGREPSRGSFQGIGTTRSTEFRQGCLLYCTQNSPQFRHLVATPSASDNDLTKVDQLSSPSRESLKHQDEQPVCDRMSMNLLER